MRTTTDTETIQGRHQGVVKFVFQVARRRVSLDTEQRNETTGYICVYPKPENTAAVKSV